MKKVFVFVVICFINTTCYASCGCAVHESNSGGDSSYEYWRNTGCSDVELQEECKRAEWELVDFVNGFVGYGVAIIQDSTNVSFQDAINLASLSYALEVERPVPDCASGLYTKTSLNGNIWDTADDAIWVRHLTWESILAPTGGLCYSKKLFDECTRVVDNIQSYVESIREHIITSNATETFKDKIIYRLDNSILPTVSCKTTEFIEDDIDSGTTRLNYSFSCIFIMLFITTTSTVFI